MKVFITKFALTKGILEADAEVCSSVSDRMIRVGAVGCYPAFYHKPDWCETRKEAIEKAELMRIYKINSLKEQIKKLEKLKFE